MTAEGIIERSLIEASSPAATTAGIGTRVTVQSRHASEHWIKEAGGRASAAVSDAGSGVARKAAHIRMGVNCEANGPRLIYAATN